MTKTKPEILNQITSLENELPPIEKIAEIAEHEGLEIAFNELTDNCCSSIKCRNFKTGKDELKELEVVNNFKKFLERQKDRIENIKDKIAQLRIELTKCQLTLFDEQNVQKCPTNIFHNEKELWTGDVFQTHNNDYHFIIESEEQKGEFAIVSTAFKEEMLLSNEKNKEILNDTAYIGNLFVDDKLADFINKLQEEDSTNNQNEDENGNS
jgi:hypothetical protein